MAVVRVHVDGLRHDWLSDDAGNTLPEKHCCPRCLDLGRVEQADARYSFGCYAGRYCDEHWAESGYRDAVDPDAEFDELDAGERIEPLD